MDSFVLAQWLFIKLLAITYIVAFWSLERQLFSLFGANGIAPIALSLEYVRKKSLFENITHFPTLFWINSSDTFLYISCWCGVIFSSLILLGADPAPLLFLNWLIYLSFVCSGSYFLAFQWDCLLLEVGFAAIFFSLLTPPPFILVFLMWLILFRLMFASGSVKILSKCPEWKQKSAMKLHYETQPLPNPVAYYIHKMPMWFHKASVYAVFFFELFVPLLYFATSEIRLIAFIFTVLFQCAIILTGNFAFFNLLTIALSIPLLGDRWLIPFFTIDQSSQYWSVTYSILNVIGALLISLSVVQLLNRFYPSQLFAKILLPFSYFYIVNSYGLFARMTNHRDEIIIEGSDDGENWLEYEFYWKPDDLRKKPAQVAPYHPRLDWQMWFAALSHYRGNPWFAALISKLLEGSREVRSLFKKDPFPDLPPKYVRALLYSYHFTDQEEKNKTGNWWKRTYKGIYIPTCTLKDK